MYARYQAALVHLTEAVLADAPLPSLLRQGATLVANTLAVAFAAVWELRSEQAGLLLRASVGWPGEAAQQLVLPLAPASLMAAATNGTSPAVVADWPGETRFAQTPWLREQRVISSVAVAIPGPRQPWGSLSVDVTASRRFNDEEIHFLQAVANVLALAVSRGQASPAAEGQAGGRARELFARDGARPPAVLEERQRLARDLHDSVTQSLYGVTLHAEAAWRLLAAGDVPSASDSLRALQATAQEALDEMRLLIFELRPPILEQVGLVAALQSRLNAVEGRAKLQTRLVADGIGTLPAPVEQALYRIALEALNNTLKHAHARQITVQLHQSSAGVVLDVTDDGDGFDLAAARASGGVGLNGIAERVAELGGTILVQSAPGAGTRLRVEVTV